MSAEDGEQAAVEGEEFNFDTWATELGLPLKVTQILRQEELSSKHALSLLETKDLKELGLLLGTIKVIMADVHSWNSPTDDANTGAKESASSPQEKVDYLDGTGKTLDILLGEPKDDPNTEPFGHMDPRTILKLKSQSTKAVHITQFLTEQSKRRRQAKCREFIIKT